MNKKLTFITLGIVGVVYLAFLFGTRSSSLFSFGFNTAPQKPSQNNTLSLVSKAQAAPGSEEQFEFLSKQRSSSCGLQPTTVSNYPDDQRIQGACCSAMDMHRYQEQVEGLKKYSDIDVIPEDPYNIPASLAKKLFDYEQNITLTAEEQAVYDQAEELAGEGGPCCCKCWRWHAFKGQAMYLISEYGWGAQEIADLWDIEDGCGGAGHEGGGH